MKVLQINSVCGYGSTGRIVTDLYDVLERKGHDSLIIFGRGTAPSNYKTKKHSTRFSFYSHVLKTRLFDLHGFGSVKSTKKIIEDIKKYEPDIIHLHNLHGYYINIEILFEFLRKADIPVVWLLHDQWAFSSHSAYFEDNSFGITQEKKQLRKQKKEYPESWLFTNYKKNLTIKQKLFTQIENLTIVTPSNWLAESTKNSFLSKHTIKVIHNGIDLETFKPTPSNFRNKYSLVNKKIILGVANKWEERKGLKYFEMLASRLPDEFKIVLIGVDDKTKKQLDKKIIAIDRTSNIKELVEIYSSADVFVNPTLEDNFPTTNIEALACGTPVITFKTGGSPEAIDDKTGIVIEKGNADELYQKIVRNCYAHFTAKDCVNRAKRFDKQKIYSDYIKMYEKIAQI